MFFSFSNPYQGTDFLSFFYRLFARTGSILKGQPSTLASDEIQVIVLIGVALSCATVGTFLVLRKMTMLANSLSHTILIGIVLAFLMTAQGHSNEGSFIAPMQAMLIGSLAVGFLTAYLTEFFSKTVRLQEDASIGLIFTTLFAVGIVLVTVLTRNAHIGIEAVMGNADALHKDDIFWVYIILGLNLLMIALFYKEYLITTFDGALSLSLGISPLIYNYLLMAQVSLTTITSFRAVGVILVLAFMTAPVMTARLFTHRLGTLLAGSAAIGSLSALVGVAITRHALTEYGMALSTAGVVVSTLFLFYLLATAGKLLHSKFS
ncbi:MAG: metal ABC transporter permease [Parachlamydia sp.]|jgi:manganese/zinc/iron transport system permease protein|nr:metal ABC transporter permease [Parachlamydia sp.]